MSSVIRSRLSLFLVCLFCTLSAKSAETDPTIIILGDSLSAAYGMQISESWPSLLQGRLTEHGHTYRVFNSSITGDTTQGGLTRLPRLLEEHQPAVVIIELGGNDGLRGLPLKVTRSNLQTMIEMSRSAGAEIILAGMKIPPNYGAEYTRQFEEIYTSLADGYEATLIPFFMEGVALNPDLMQDDGIHPNAAGQPVLLASVWAVLLPLLGHAE
jgi:acyl-CoA thioesterase-1